MILWGRNGFCKYATLQHVAIYSITQSTDESAIHRFILKLHLTDFLWKISFHIELSDLQLIQAVCYV